MPKRTYTIDSNGCFIGSGKTDRDGYCRAWDKITKRNTFAHRLAYEKVYGKIPEGKVIDHICRVRNCLNPKHLRVVTVTENTRLGNVPKLSLEKASRIKLLYEGRVTQSYLAQIFGVDQAQISRVLNGKAWL